MLFMALTPKYRMSEHFSNNAVTTLANSIGTTDTEITVSNADGFPSPNFRIVIDTEIMLVTAVSGVVFTVTRAIESTSLVGHTSNATVAQVLTAGALHQAITDMTIEGQFTVPPVTYASAASFTLDCSASNKHYLDLSGQASATITLENYSLGEYVTVRCITNQVTAVTWAGLTLLWSVGSQPAISGTGIDTFVFLCSDVGSSSFDAYVVAQGM